MTEVATNPGVWRVSGTTEAGHTIIIRGDASSNRIVAEVYLESDVPRIIGASEVYQALAACVALDARMMAAARAPDGDDYNQVMSLLLHAFTKTMPNASRGNCRTPASAGKPWDAQEDLTLRILVRAHLSIPHIAQILKRTTAGINARCEHLRIVTNDGERL